MSDKINANAGFWRRLIARGIDMVLIFIFSYAILFFCLKPSKGAYIFKENYLFYIWTLWSITLFLLFIIIIPLYTKGQSIGYKILKIKIITTNNNLIRSILYREIFFTFGWILTISVVAILVNHTLIFQVAQIKAGGDLSKQLTVWQKTRISVSGSIGALIVIAQMILAITIIPDKNKQGFHDKTADAKVICTKKFITSKASESIILKFHKSRNVTANKLEFKGEWNKNEIEW